MKRRPSRPTFVRSRTSGARTRPPAGVGRNRSRDEARARAALLALGALDGQDGLELERALESASASYRADLEGFIEVANDLALAVEPVAPRPEVCARVMARIAAAEGILRAGDSWPEVSRARITPEFLFGLQDEAAWEDLAKGVSRKPLLVDDRAGIGVYLVRMSAGAAFATHVHRSAEHCYVVSGDLHVAGRHIHAGDYHRAAPGSVHQAPRSDAGCLLLVIQAAA